MLWKAIHDVLSTSATSDVRVPNKSKKASASRGARNACPVLRPKTTKTPVRHSSCRMPASIAEKLPSIDDTPILLPTGTSRAKLFVMEDNEACIKMCVKGRSPAMRHVSRTHRVNLDWLYERVMYDPGVHIRFCPTKFNIADTLTKGSFSSVNWRKLLDSCNTMESRKLAKPQNKPTLTISAHKGKGRGISKNPNTTTYGTTQFVPGLVAVTRRDMIFKNSTHSSPRGCSCCVVAIGRCVQYMAVGIAQRTQEAVLCTEIGWVAPIGRIAPTLCICSFVSLTSMVSIL